jgi:hypothetical protein
MGEINIESPHPDEPYLGYFKNLKMGLVVDY